MSFLNTISGGFGMTVDQMRSLQPALAALLEKFRGCFKKSVTFRYWQCYLLGLMADLERKSIEPIALASGVAVRTLQEFLSQFAWDHDRASTMLQQLVMDEHSCDEAIGIIDGSGHHKQGKKTPGVQRQWCGETGKIDNCIVGQHLLYTDNDAKNPFTCMIASDLYIPKSWHEDRDRCREAKIPDDVVYRPKWRIALDQVRDAIGNGIRFSWLTFDEEYGSVPSFIFGLDTLGQRGIGEVRSNFTCWVTLPKYGSLRSDFASKRVDNVCRLSRVFKGQTWQRLHIKDTTHGPMIWELKAARVHLVDRSGDVPKPTDRLYWLIVARNPKTGEVKYFVSNAPGNATLEKMMAAAFARWHVEKWFERAKQEAGFGAFEVRTYTSLIRHWLCSRMVMYFLAATTQRLRGGKSADHSGAGRTGGEYVGGKDMGPLLAQLG